MTCYDRSLAPDKHRAPHTGRGSDSLVLIEAGGFCPKFYGILLYVAKQNFKISTSEYQRCASKCSISRLNNQNFYREGAQPPPQTLPRRGGGHPSPHPTPLGPLGASPPRRLDAAPQTKILPTPLVTAAFSNVIYEYKVKVSSRTGQGWHPAEIEV